MANNPDPDFNAQVDYFGLSGSKFEIISSTDGKSHTVAEKGNHIGDVTAREEHSVRQEPSVTYKVIGETKNTDLPAIGAFVSASGQGATKFVVDSVAIDTKSGEAPTITIHGKSVGTQAAALRTYALPALTVTPRHRAQKILDAIQAANFDDDTTASSITFTGQVTYADPKGAIKVVDIHGGKWDSSKTIYANAAGASSATKLETGSAGENAFAEKTVTETGDLVGSEVTPPANQA